MSAVYWYWLGWGAIALVAFIYMDRSGLLHELLTKRPITGWLKRTAGNILVLFWPVVRAFKQRLGFFIPWVSNRKNAAQIGQNVAILTALAGLLVGKQFSLTADQIALIVGGISMFANMIHPYSVPNAPTSLPEVEPGGMVGPGASAGA